MTIGCDSCPSTPLSLTIDDRNVRYLTTGPDDGRPVVRLHGVSFFSETWREIGTLDTLAEVGDRGFADDLPGTGKSESSDSAPAAWVRTLLDELKVETPVVVLPSMSGRFALPLVTEEPERFGGFVAVAPVDMPEYEQKFAQITGPVLAVCCALSFSTTGQQPGTALLVAFGSPVT